MLARIGLRERPGASGIGAGTGVLLVAPGAALWGSSTALGRFVLRDVPFHALTGARLLLLALVPGLLGLLL